VLTAPLSLAIAPRDRVTVILIAIGCLLAPMLLLARRTPWLVAAVVVPGMTAAFVGALIWRSPYADLRGWLWAAPIATALIFGVLRVRLRRIALLALVSGLVTVAMFVVGVFVIFIFTYHT